MDIFRFTNPNAPTLMKGGKIITGTISKTWIERYAEAGTFEIVGYTNTGLREQLPRGSYISHVDSHEIMKVENHEINSDGESEPTIKITGRSMEAPILETRVVGSNIEFPTSGAPVDYVIPAWSSWNQTVSLIARHIRAEYLLNPADAIPYIEVYAEASGHYDTPETRTIKRGDVYSRVIELLAVDKLGLKTVRPGLWSNVANPNSVGFVVHKGVDRSAKVAFSFDAGDIESADYLWSIKNQRNCALVSGRWVQTLIDCSAEGINRKMLFVDANDVDDAQEHIPTGAARTLILAAMRARGREALAKRNNVALVRVDASHNGTKAIFREDYDVGDIVTADGDYSESAKMRISEYAEIEDENGVTAYPTLTSLEGEIDD